MSHDSRRAGAVVCDRLLAGRFAKRDRPTHASLGNGWPADVRPRVLVYWHAHSGR